MRGISPLWSLRFVALAGFMLGHPMPDARAELPASRPPPSVEPACQTSVSKLIGSDDEEISDRPRVSNGGLKLELGCAQLSSAGRALVVVDGTFRVHGKSPLESIHSMDLRLGADCGDDKRCSSVLQSSTRDTAKFQFHLFNEFPVTRDGKISVFFKVPKCTAGGEPATCELGKKTVIRIFPTGMQYCWKRLSDILASSSRFTLAHGTPAQIDLRCESISKKKPVKVRITGSALVLPPNGGAFGDGLGTAREVSFKLGEKCTAGQPCAAVLGAGSGGTTMMEFPFALEGTMEATEDKAVKVPIILEACKWVAATTCALSPHTVIEIEIPR